MRQVKKDSTNVSVDVYIIDSTDGTPELGVLFNTAGMDLEYRREGAAVVNITEATLAALTTAHTDGGFLEIGHGLYRLDLPDAAVATGAETVSIQGTVTGMIVLPQTVQLVDFDPEDGVRLGLTALPNAVADAAGGLPISDAGGLDLDTKLANTNEVTVARMGALTDWINGGRLDLLLDAIPTTAMRGTDSAALASVATEARLAELDAANLPADLDAVLLDTADMQPLIEKMAYVGAYGLGVWIDDGAANTNTVLGTDGTPDNPVSTIAAGTTIATSLGSQRFYLVNDTVITLAQTYEGYEFIGVGVSNQITLGSQDVDNSLFRNVTLTGTQGGTQFMRAIDCQLQAILSGEILADECWLTGDITLRAATNHSFGMCKSGMPGNATPDLTFPGAGTTSVNFRHYSGGLTVKSATALDTMSYESDGQIVIDATCTSLTISVRGNCSITDNGTTTSLTQDAAVNLTNLADAVWDEILTGATHNIATSAGRRLRGIQEFQGYEGGAIWIDTVNGTAGTTDFENGTVENPVDSIADANTLAASLGISRFVVIAGSTITFAASQQNQIFEGAAWTLALGGQNIDGSMIVGATVSGIATNTAGVQFFLDCIMNATTIPGDTHVIRCGIGGTQTLGEAGDYFFDACHSAIAGTATPVMDFGSALNASNLNVRHYSGGVEIQNMGAGTGSYTMSLEGDGQLVINANCSATSTVAIRGNFTVTDNAAGAVTLSDDARIDVTQINDEVKDVLETDTHAEPSAVPAATASLKDKINWQSALARNKLLQTATTQTLRNDADAADIATATVSDDGTTATREEWS